MDPDETSRLHCFTSFFSSLEQCSGRAIVLSPASANVNGHMIDLIYILYVNPKFYAVPSQPEVQGHRLRIYYVKFWVKVFIISKPKDGFDLYFV